jgi:hypothetical protein
MNKSKCTPFCWQDKRALRIIREQSEDYGTALAVYVALSVVASDLQRDQFETTHSWLAQIAGLSERTIRRRLEDLKRIGLVTISTPKLKAPSTYTLLTIGHDGRTIGHQVRTIGHRNSIPWPPSEESKKGIPPTPKADTDTSPQKPLDWKAARKALL